MSWCKDGGRGHAGGDKRNWYDTRELLDSQIFLLEEMWDDIDEMWYNIEECIITTAHESLLNQVNERWKSWISISII